MATEIDEVKPNPNYVSAPYTAYSWSCVFDPLWVKTRKQRLNFRRLTKKTWIRLQKERQKKYEKLYIHAPLRIYNRWRSEDEPRTISFHKTYK